MTRVVTYQNGAGDTVRITPEQEDILRSAGEWPRNAGGYFASVHHGLHRGRPTWSDREIQGWIDRGATGGHPAFQPAWTDNI